MISVKIFSSTLLLFFFLKGICFPVPLCVNMQMPPIRHLSLKLRFDPLKISVVTFTSEDIPLIFSNVVISTTWIGIL